MNEKLVMFGIVLLACLLSGCVSHSVLNESKEQVAIRKAILTNNESALHAIKMGSDHKAYGIVVTTWEAIQERPLIQTGAAIADGLIIWGGYEGVQWLKEESSGGGKTLDSGRDSTSIQISGDGNTVVVRGDENNYGFPSE